ncbi:MAG: nucleotide sugar dehydrogenase [Planctomycetota bacterium]
MADDDGRTAAAASTLGKVREREATVGVIGLGYVGLPLAEAFGHAGFSITGFDIDPDKVERLNDGRSYVKAVPDESLSALRDDELFEATSDFDRLSEPDCILICVPTPLKESREPNMTYVRRTADDIGRSLRPGQLVVLESTTYPGTTRELLQPILEEHGLKVEEDFYLAYSPEREDPGNPDHTVSHTPKVVGGAGEKSLQVAKELYEAVAPRVVQVSSTACAEATKLLENVYRAVNIALVNELKVIFDDMDVDIWEVVDAASTKPFGFQPFYPGPGWGGHCIPIDPFYLSWKARQFGTTAHFIERAGEVNTAMTDFVAGKITEALNEHRKPVNGSDILVLGVAYKPDVDDIRESPALPLIERLRNMGASVSYHDPHIPSFPSLRDYPDLDLEAVDLTARRLEESDAVVVITDHSDYDYSWVAEHAPLVVDTRNCVPEGPEGTTVVHA